MNSLDIKSNEELCEIKNKIKEYILNNDITVDKHDDSYIIKIFGLKLKVSTSFGFINVIKVTKIAPIAERSSKIKRFDIVIHSFKLCNRLKYLYKVTKIKKQQNSVSEILKHMEEN